MTTIAVPNFRGAGSTQACMAAFNETLWDDLENSGYFKLIPRSLYPIIIPQQPSDLREGSAQTPSSHESSMGDWSKPPASTNYLVFGYGAVQNSVFVLRGWLYDLGRPLVNAQMLGNTYFGPAVDEVSARKIAHQFAADIITTFGGTPTIGTHIYFVSDRTGHKEIWVTDPDGSNQKQITKFNFIANFPAISPDGLKLAFTAWPADHQTPRIFVFSTDPVRDLHFSNQLSSVNGTPSFTPDGNQIVYSSSPGGCCRIFIAQLDGTRFRSISGPGAIEAEPKINPKNGAEIVFTSGRSGPQQLYRMNIEGGDSERLTPGIGEASNPSWHPNGQTIAFAWTKGYATGNFNIFTMDVASRVYTQLTHNEGRNENPSWAPDGVHIVFASNRTGSFQLWTILADGTQLRQLTRIGKNISPVWGH
jgi:TolB protein